MNDQVFISYSKKDSQFAHKLANDLKIAGFKIWFDDSITGGQQWREKIESNLEAAGDVIVVLSQNALDSQWVPYEGALALGWKKPLFPLLIEKDIRIPPWLHEVQYINFTNQSYQQAFEELTRALTPPNPIQDLLELELHAYREHGDLIGEAILRVIEENRDTLVIDAEADELIKQSQQEFVRRQVWEQQLLQDREIARQRELEKAQQLLYTQRQRAIYLAVGLLAAIVLSIISFSLFQQSNRNLSDAQAANTQSAANAATATRALGLSEQRGTEAAHNLSNANLANTQSAANGATAQAASTQAVAQRDLAATALVEAESQRNMAEQQARVALSRKLAAQANSYLEDDLGLALLLANEASQQAVTYEARQILLASLQYSPRLMTSLYRTGEWGIENINRYGLNSITLNPDGKLMATTSSDRKVLLWDISDPYVPLLLDQLNEHTKYVSSVAFSPDGKILASAGWDGIIILRDVSDPTATVQLGEIRTGGHLGWVNNIVFSPDGNILASGSCSKTDNDYPYDFCELGEIILWDITNPTDPISLGEPLDGYEYSVYSFTFSPDSRILAAGSEEGIIVLWDVSDPANPHPLGQQIKSYMTRNSIAFSPDGKTLGSGGWRKEENDSDPQGEIRLWDITNLSTPVPLGQPFVNTADRIYSIAFSPDGKTLASGGCKMNKAICILGDLRLWDITNPVEPLQISQPLIGHTRTVLSVVFSPDGKTLASGGYDNTVRLWNISDPKTPPLFGQSLSGHRSLVTSVVFRPDNNILVTGGWDNIVILWDISNLATPLLLDQLTTGMINGIAISPDGRTLASGGKKISEQENEDSPQGEIRLWDISNPVDPHQIGQPLVGDRLDVSSIAFSPNGKILASVGSENIIYLWDITNLTDPKLLSQQPPEQEMGGSLLNNNISFSPDGKILASGRNDGKVFLWDVSEPADLVLLGQVDHYISAMRGISIAFSPDGKILATCGGAFYLWDISDLTNPILIGERIFSQTGSVEKISFSPDGGVLATGGVDNGTVTLWDISNPSFPSQIGQLSTGQGIDHKNWVTSLAFSPDGRTLIEGGWDGNVILWDVSTAFMQALACQKAGRNFTQAEWQQYFPGEEYRITCPQWPAGQ